MPTEPWAPSTLHLPVLRAHGCFPYSPRDSGPRLGLSCFSTPSRVLSGYCPFKQSKSLLVASAATLASELFLCCLVSPLHLKEGFPQRVVFNMPNSKATGPLCRQGFSIRLFQIHLFIRIYLVDDN